jgi:mycothiol maleylpyruvate isomerase-like protein
VRHTKREVLARTRREFTILDRLLSRLKPGDWKRRVPRLPTRDPWTVQDALAHIVYWKAHSARVFRGERRLSEMRGLDVNQINRLVYLRWRRRRPRELVAWHRRVHLDVLTTLARNPSAWFSGRQRSGAWPLDFDGHSAAHRTRDIEAALTRERVSGRRPR